MGLNTLQLEFEVQKILYKGNTKLVIYGLQIAREFNISIRKEIEEIKNGDYCENDNVLKNAPHIIDDSIDWNYSYSREKAFFPMESLKKYKFWPSIKRVDDKFGDKKMYECY